MIHYYHNDESTLYIAHTNIQLKTTRKTQRALALRKNHKQPQQYKQLELASSWLTVGLPASRSTAVVELSKIGRGVETARVKGPKLEARRAEAGWCSCWWGAMGSANSPIGVWGEPRPKSIVVCFETHRTHLMTACKAQSWGFTWPPITQHNNQLGRLARTLYSWRFNLKPAADN